jgi:hypothetical protein
MSKEKTTTKVSSTSTDSKTSRVKGSVPTTSQIPPPPKKK